MSYIVWIIFQSLSHLIFLYTCQGISPVKSGFLSIVSSILSVIKYGKVKLVLDKTHGGLGEGDTQVLNGYPLANGRMEQKWRIVTFRGCQAKTGAVYRRAVIVRSFNFHSFFLSLLYVNLNF